MSEYNIDIADMQCWVFRMAQAKWKMAPSDCAELFKKYDILGFIAGLESAKAESTEQEPPKAC